MTYEFPPIGGGGANVALPLAASLVERGHCVDVVTSGMPDLPPNENCCGVDVHRVRCFRRYRHYATTPELMTYVVAAYRYAVDLIAKRQFDVNHTHFALPTGLASYYLYRKTGLPYVITVHGSDVPGYNPDRFILAHSLARPLWRKVINHSSGIVSASQSLKDLLQKAIDVPVTVIPNGCSLTLARSSVLSKKNRILVVSRMFRRKGIQDLLQALTGLAHDWEVLIVGDGPYLSDLKKLAQELAVDVTFAGYQQGRALNDMYATSRIFVFPSLQENFPVVLLEAMQAGCAIITTTIPGCANVVGDAAVTVEPGKPDHLRNALISLINDEDRIHLLGTKARERLGEFGWDRIAKSYDDVLSAARHGDFANSAQSNAGND